MKKSTLGMFAAAFTGIALSVSGFAAGFETKNQYAEGTFTDVASSEWYAKEVKSAYELGFMNGVGTSLFSPDGKVTVAEAVTMASRVHASYNGKTIENAEGEWYQMYVNYAIANGIIEEGQFDNYDRNIKRYEMAVVFHNSVPAEWLNKVNNVDYLPDINEMADYRDEILALYNSGVVMGNDAYGTFYPNNEIIRCEAAAIINRIAIPSNRLTKALEKREAPVPAMYFIDDTGGMSMTVYGQYGWEFDQRGGPAGTPSDTIYVIDTSKTERTAMLRTFAEHGTGKITMEMNVEATLATNGLSFILNKDEQKNAMHFVTKNGTFHAVEGDKLTDTGVAVPKNFYIKTITDMEAKTNTLIIDGKLVGTYGFADADCTSVNTLTISGTKEDEVVAKVSKTKLYTGYALNDIFLGFTNRAELPYNWKLEGGAQGKLSYLQSNSYDVLSAEITAPANTNNVLSTTFDPISRKVCFEMKFRMEDYVDGTKFALTSDGNEIVSIYTQGDSYYANGAFLKKYNSNVWQSIRFEANTDTGVVDYKINYKKVGSGYFNATSFDGISITLPAKKDVTMMLDDFLVYNLFDEEPDYVPEPVPVESDEAIVGIEVCDIWRNGFQHGWDYTSAYDELYTYLGMFDEGSTEVADWETKWLVEHGVDFKLVCWYSGTSSQPLKTPRNSYGLMAQLNSKYSDMMKYAIMWENAGNNPGSSEQFRKNIVDYWVEYHLSDKDRYFTIDNKALITIYQSGKLIDVFGSVEAVKAELDYLRQVCVDLGYDGAVILTTGTPSENVYKMGFDGIYAYNWGQKAYDIEYQKTAIKSQEEKANAAGITCVPTIGVGFCNMFLGQGNSRSPLITPEDYETILNWTTDEFLKGRIGEPWQTNMVILSNWNEFGEGHYILPTNRIGFTYLDAIRNAFSSAEHEHSDLRPDDETRARYNALYDQNRKRVRRYELESEDDSFDFSTLSSFMKWDFREDDTEEIFRNNHNTTVEYTGSSVKGVSQAPDFAITTKKSISFDANSAEYLRIVYKLKAASEKNTAQFYFVTKADGSWNDQKCVNFDVVADNEYHEYIINLTSCGKWKGIISGIRFDPVNREQGVEWEIQEFEFLDKPSSYEIYVNGFATPTPTVFSPEYENGVLAAAIDPYADKFYAKLGIFYRWDYNSQKLYLYGLDDKYIIFTMGESTAKTSDGDVMLGMSPRLVDGIPMIEIDSMAKALGLNLVVADGKYNISHPNIGSLEGGTASDIVWDFDTSGYIDGFTIACAEVQNHEDGKVSFLSKTNGKRHDPVMNSPAVTYDAVKYEKVVVGFSYDLTGGYGEATGITSSIFFAAPNGAFNGTDVVQVKTEGLSSNGKTIEVEFDMTSKENYSGTIGKIRFDPFEAEGTFTVDYIKIVLTNPEGKIKVKEKAKEFTWKPGDNTPEGTTFAAQNGTMSIATNPNDENEKVFKMTATAKSRSWAYFNVYMHFVPGAKYNVKFKLYGIETATGEKYADCTMGGNFIYGGDGETVSNHTFGPGQVKYGEWIEFSKIITVSEEYVPSNKDCFQLWSNPTNNIATGYLVSDITVELVD